MLVEYLSKKLLLEVNYIENLANTASQRYVTYTIPKKNGGKRVIHHPAKEIKTLQRVIYEDILDKLPVHKCAYAYKKGTNLLDHAHKHVGSKYLLRMDFKNFFESISIEDITTFIDRNSHLLEQWEEGDTEFLTKIVCFHSSLTIGSVTSPCLSNNICYELDEKLHGLCFADGVTYTRYADDLYFSTSKPDVLSKVQKKVIQLIKSMQLPSRLKVNHSKTHHASSKNRMAVTGLVLTNEGNISIGKQTKRKIKSMIFNWIKLNKNEQKYLVGYLSFCTSVEPSFINNLCRKYGATIIDEIQRTTFS
jgi:RNA-directed DNA polymerase